MQDRFPDILSMIQTLVLLGGFVVSARQLILLGRQISLMTRELDEQVDWQRKNATFDYLNLYITELKDTNRELQGKLDLLKQDGESRDLQVMIEELKGEDARSDLFHLVSYFENLAIGIEHDYFDEPVARALLQNAVVAGHKSLKPYLLLRRNETGLRVGSNFEKLAKRWDTA